MNTKNDPREIISTVKHLLYWVALIVPVAIVTGSLVALFLWLLDTVTQLRWQHGWLVFLLPLAGVLIYFVYKKYGKNSEAGNNLVIEEIHEPGGGIPARMTPFILASTVITHLFGGSAGREGTAVQMGGSISFLFSKWYRLEPSHRRILLMCGIAAGFGAVFGTPVAGAVFALEVLTIGSIKYEALIPCLIAAVLADLTCAAYGIHHTQYSIAFTNAGKWGLSFLPNDLWLLGKVLMAGACFGITGYLFARTVEQVKSSSHRLLKQPWLVPIVGGIAVIGISYALGSFDYLGLGVTNPGNGVSIVTAFHANGANGLSWLWKLLLTAITIGTGFKGGEVTPLFFIGATLGNTLATISGSPVDLFAGLGFIAVFAGATNTPLACTLMGAELFGAENIVYYAVACFAAYYFSGKKGIYGAQRTGKEKIVTK